jgi:hypothetical protein
MYWALFWSIFFKTSSGHPGRKTGFESEEKLKARRTAGTKAAEMFNSGNNFENKLLDLAVEVRLWKS